MNTLHCGRTDEETCAWGLKSVMPPVRGCLGLNQATSANLPTRRVVVGFVKPEAKTWGEHLIAISIASSLQYRITIEGSVSQPEDVLQVASAFIASLNGKKLDRSWRS